MSEVQTRSEQSDEPILGSGDHLFGVCEAIGKDLGFDPLYLRVLLFSLMFFSPLWMLAAYTGLAAVLGLSRWIAPTTARAEAAKTVEQPANEAAAEQVQLAA